MDCTQRLSLRLSLRLSYLLLVSFFILSCAAPTSPQPASNRSPAQTSTLYPEEVASALLTDDTLTNDLEIQNQRFTRSDNLYLAESILQNKTEQPLIVEVRVFFKSTPGETLETSPWKRMVIPPKQRVSYAAPTLNRLVTRYLLEIRRSP
ncbi:MAG: hypothetical protein SH807_04975 [Blastochloris sp.]|jgi:uncharacterized protein YcfL|nr:hypothetical protein [Blastochloris sp.]